METTYNPIPYSCWTPYFGGGVLGFLLGSLLSPGGFSSGIYPTLPEATSEVWNAYNEESKDASDEEKKELMKKYFDPEGLIDKYFEKLKNPKEAAKLNAKLIKLDAKIAVINQKKQQIVDNWVKS